MFNFICDFVVGEYLSWKWYWQRRKIVKKHLASFPKHLGFRFHELCLHSFELRSKTCKFYFSFERYEPDGAVTLIAPPHANAATDGMSFWILCHIRGVPFNLPLADLVVEHFSDVLAGDFSIQKDYELLEKRIFNKMYSVQKLPADDPIRKLYDAYDIRWLHELEKLDSGS